MELLQEFDFHIEYVRGKENVIVDALSRRPLPNAISCIINYSIEEIKAHYLVMNSLNILFESLSKDARTTDEIDKSKCLELKNEVLYYNGRVCDSKFGK